MVASFVVAFIHEKHVLQYRSLQKLHALTWAGCPGLAFNSIFLPHCAHMTPSLMTLFLFFHVCSCSDWSHALNFLMHAFFLQRLYICFFLTYPSLPKGRDGLATLPAIDGRALPAKDGRALPVPAKDGRAAPPCNDGLAAGREGRAALATCGDEKWGNVGACGIGTWFTDC